MVPVHNLRRLLLHSTCCVINTLTIFLQIHENYHNFSCRPPIATILGSRESLDCAGTNEQSKRYYMVLVHILRRLLLVSTFRVINTLTILLQIPQNNCNFSCRPPITTILGSRESLDCAWITEQAKRVHMVPVHILRRLLLDSTCCVINTLAILLQIHKNYVITWSQFII